MVPYFTELAYGNPTITHKPGWMAYETVQRASEELSGYVGAHTPEEVNFTPGETEANNLAIFGAALANKDRGRRIVVSEIEPLSIIFTSKLLERHGFEVRKLPVDGEGFVDLDVLSNLVREAVETVRDRNPKTLFHTDLSDAYGRIPVNVSDMDVDLATFSSYKVLGPRGVGALYVREGVKVERLLEGQIGTQRLWPGVENIPLIVGFLKASELMFRDFEANVEHMRRLRDRLMDGILNEIPDTLLNGPREKRAPDNVNVSFLGCEGEALTIELSLRGVYVSSGSACTRRMLQPSHVLTAMGRKPEEAHGSVLMKVSRTHTTEDVEYVLEVLPEAVERLRRLSPLSKSRGG